MSVTVSQYKNFVGGESVDAVEGGTMEVLNPATGETIAEVPSGTEADVERAVDAARKAQPEWAEATPKERSEVLLKLADLVDEHAEELAQLETLNVGKPLMASRDEMPFAADNLRYYAGAARNLEGKATGEYIKGYTSMIRREPIGIVAGIMPWNYPLMMADLEARPRARGGQRPDPEAGRGDAALDHQAAGAGQGRDPGRRAQRDHRRRHPGRLRARRAPRDRARLAHRATSRPARRSPATPPTRSSASTSSSAARRRW